MPAHAWPVVPATGADLPPLHADVVHVWYLRSARSDPREVLAEARAALDRLLCRYAGLDCAPPLQRGERGKPFAPSLPHLHFNVSHGGSHVLLAFARGQALGVDLERIDRRVDPLSISARYFAPREHAALAAMPAADCRRAFLRLWTAKEAVLKALGEGLVYGLHRVEFDVSIDGAQRLLALDEPAGPATAWQVPALDPPREDLIAALAWRGEARRVHCFTLPPAATNALPSPSA